MNHFVFKIRTTPPNTKNYSAMNHINQESLGFCQMHSSDAIASLFVCHRDFHPIRYARLVVGVDLTPVLVAKSSVLAGHAFKMEYPQRFLRPQESTLFHLTDRE